MPTFVKLDAQKLTSESGFPNSHALHEGQRSSRGPLADDKSTSSGWSASRQGNKEPEDRKVSAHLRRRVSKDFVVGHFRKDTNLGDLRQSPATARKLDKLVSEIRRESNVIIPERDRKIAALMLVKHQEEQDRLELRLKAQQFWDKLKRAERLAEMKKETERQKGLINSIGRWKKEQETRHSKIQQDVKQMAELREQDVIWKENKWRMLAENQKLKKKEKLDQAKCEAEIRKSQQKQLQKQSEAVKQDTKEQEVQVSQAKLSNAAQKRLLKEMSNQNRIKTENEHEKLRHTILKNEIDTLTKTEELMVRMSLERKLLTFKENHRQLVEERKRSLKEKVIREENQILQAKLKADKLEQEQKERKEALAEISDLKIEQAQKTLLKRVQSKVLQTQRSRSEKERIPQTHNTVRNTQCLGLHRQKAEVQHKHSVLCCSHEWMHPAAQHHDYQTVQHHHDRLWTNDPPSTKNARPFPSHHNPPAFSLEPLTPLSIKDLPASTFKNTPSVRHKIVLGLWHLKKPLFLLLLQCNVFRICPFVYCGRRMLEGMPDTQKCC